MHNLPLPTHEGGSVYLNGFSSGPKPYEEVLTFLRKVLLLAIRWSIDRWYPIRTERCIYGLNHCPAGYCIAQVWALLLTEVPPVSAVDRLCGAAVGV